MKTLIAACVCIALGAAPCLPADGTGDDDAVMTSFTVLVGFPSGEEAATGGVLLVPGTVIPMETRTDAVAAGGRQEALRRSVALTQAVDKLWSTFRLDPGRRIQKGKLVAATVDSTHVLPGLDEAGVTFTASLMGFNDSVATYRVVFRQGEEALADSTLGVNRGGRAVVGGMNGEAAPYIFVIVEPDPPGAQTAGSVRFTEESGISEPIVQEKVNPRYPEQARKDKIVGTVVLDLIIGTDGRVVRIHTLESAHSLLEEAAIEAVGKWRFEPARRPDGSAVQVMYVITIKFNLQ